MFGKQKTKKTRMSVTSRMLRTSIYVFNWRLKVDSDDDNVTNDDRLFHARAAATGKARSPIVLQRVAGTTTAVDKLERRLRLMVTSVARLMLSARYTGAVPLRDRKTRHDNLKVIRSGIRSQWSSRSNGVTWSNFLVLNTIRAAACTTGCSRQSWRASSPASVALP